MSLTSASENIPVDAPKHGHFNRLITLERIINQSISVAYIRNNDADWTVSYISQNISRFGYTPENFYPNQLGFASLIHPDDIPRVRAELFFANNQNRNDLRLEYRILSKTNEFFWVSDDSEIIRNEQGVITQFQGLFTDISHRIEIEEKINAQNRIINLRHDALTRANENLKRSNKDLTIANQKLIESELKFKIISEQSQLGVFIIQDGLIKYFNNKFAALVDYTEEEIWWWKEFEFMKAIYPDDEVRILTTIDKIMDSDEDKEYHFEFRRVSKHNEVRWSSHWSKPIIYEGRKAILITLYDVDDRKKWQDALEIRENRLRAKLDFILSPEKPMGDFSLSDIFDIEQLQKIQDAFAITHNVASVITDIEGNPITAPSNFSPVCQIIRSTTRGRELCHKSDKLIGQQARKLLKPFSTNCLSCGFVDAGAPIIIAGKHIANWMIGQALKNGLNEERIRETARKLGSNEQQMVEAFREMSFGEIGQFNNVMNFLWIMAKEISALGYNNLKLARDIEERKAMEKALRESEDLYRQVLQTSPDGIALVDMKGNMLYISPKAKQLFGYPEDHETKGLCIFDFIEPSDLTKAIANVTEIFHHNNSNSGIYTMVRRDNSTFIAEINSATVNDYQGHNKAMISVIRDVSERKKVEEELIKAKNKAEESDRLKSAFLANMSHEIRTPMNGIIGFANLLKDGDTTQAERLEYSEIINQNGNLLLKLIDDILDIARIESGQLNIVEKPCYLDQLLYDKYLFFKTFVETNYNKNLRLILKLPEYKIEHQIIADRARIDQVLTNLISNAIKFTDQGYIEFGYILESPAQLKFYVRDTGIGLASEKQTVIFDRFRQADESQSRIYGGAGLGLAISSNLIKLMGGTMWVESEEGKGSIFYFTIPYKPDFENGKFISIPIAENKIEYFNWHDKSILIAEDEQVNFVLLNELLKTTQIHVIHAKNGKEAIDMCKDNSQIDLVLMDIKMPEVNGYAATREIKKLRHDLPVIAQSAYAMEDEINKCREAGCDDYISKPIDNQKLLILINDFLTRQ
jgi:PAS domain S-box-containing protein